MNATKTTAAPVENAPVLYTPENIMAIMHISRSSVYKLFSSEGFPSIKMGGILRIEKTAFEKWLNTYAGKSFTESSQYRGISYMPRYRKERSKCQGSFPK